jgi:hypothetical protein
VSLTEAVIDGLHCSGNESSVSECSGYFPQSVSTLFNSVTDIAKVSCAGKQALAFLTFAC